MPQISVINRNIVTSAWVWQGVTIIHDLTPSQKQFPKLSTIEYFSRVKFIWSSRSQIWLMLIKLAFNPFTWSTLSSLGNLSCWESLCLGLFLILYHWK